YHVFVTKIDAGGAPVYSTYLGGSVAEVGFGIAIDGSGNAYVAGATGSANFPTTAGAYQRSIGGGADAFATKLSPTGSALVYSTYLGGSGDDWGQAIAVDGSGAAYVTGHTSSTNFPTSEERRAAYDGGASYASVSKIKYTGAALVDTTYRA